MWLFSTSNQSTENTDGDGCILASESSNRGVVSSKAFILSAHVEQSDLCLHYFEYLVCVCIELGDFKQTKII